MLPAAAEASPWWFTWIVLPILIFAARSVDMTLSTLRIVFISEGRTKLAPIIAFFEALLWLLVVGQALRHLSNPMCVFAYAGGYAAGSRFGLQLERRLAMGTRMLRIITRDEAADTLLASLRRADFGVTEVEGQGARGTVKILFTVVRRRDLERALAMVRSHDPQAFVSVADVREAEAGVFPSPIRNRRDRLRWGAWRKRR